MLIFIACDFWSGFSKVTSKWTNLWVELLLRSCVAILTSLGSLTFTRISPFLALFHSWTWQCSVAARANKNVVKHVHKQANMHL